MHWPGAGIAILIGLILFAMVFIPLFVFAHYRNESHIRGQFIFVIVASMTAILFLSFMALTVSKDVLSEYVAVEGEMEDVLNDLKVKNNAYVQHIINISESDLLVTSVHQKTEAIESWIDDLKSELVIATEPGNEDVIAAGEIDFSKITRKDALNIPADILIIQGRATQLAEKIKEYKGYLLSETHDVDLALQLDMLLDISEFRISDDYTISWENVTFEHRPFVSNLNTLTFIQIKLRLAEKEFLKSFSKKAGSSGQQIIAEEIKVY